MNAVAQQLLDVGKQKALVQAQLTIVAGKKAFLESFAHFVTPEDLYQLDLYFGAALNAKVKQFVAQTDEEAQVAADEYEGSLDTIASVFLRYEVVGKAKLNVVARNFAHALISGVFAVGGAVLQAALSIFVPVAGGLVGAGVNAGIQHVVAYFLGD